MAPEEPYSGAFGPFLADNKAINSLSRALIFLPISPYLLSTEYDDR